MSEISGKVLSKCSKCQSTMLLKYFSVNKKGELYKTCDNCRDKRRKNNPNGTKKLTIEHCREIGNELNWTLLSDTYINNRQKLEWQCDNGHITFCNIDLVKRAQQCLQCYNMRRGDTRRGNIEECQKVAEERGGKCLSMKYVSRREKMLWECAKGHQWEAKFSHIKNSNEWCPHCTGSHSEELARTLMEECYGEKFQKVRPEWLDGLELDGYNEDLKIGFEYNGIQHYDYIPHFHRNGIEDLYKQQKNDHRKYDICKERGIHLIVIPNEYSYQNEDEMRNFLEKNL